MKHLHPSILILPTTESKGTYYDKLIEEAETFCSQDKILYKIADYSFDIEGISKLRPTHSELAKRLVKDKLELKNTIIISFVDLTQGQKENEKYLSFLETLFTHKHINSNEFLLLNIFIRDLDRDSFDSQSFEGDFFRSFEEVFRREDFSGRIAKTKINNIIVDNFNAETGYKFYNDTNLVVSQFFRQLKFIIETQSLGLLSHCNAPVVSYNKESSVRYNIIGSATVGFDKELTAKALSLKMKHDALQDLLVCDDYIYENEDPDLIFNLKDKTKQFVADSFENIKLKDDFHRAGAEFLSTVSSVAIVNQYDPKGRLDAIDQSSPLLESEFNSLKNELIDDAKRIKATLLADIDRFISQLFDKEKAHKPVFSCLYSVSSVLNLLRQKQAGLGLSKSVEFAERPAREPVEYNLSLCSRTLSDKEIQLERNRSESTVHFISKGFVNLIVFPALGAILALLLYLFGADLANKSSIVSSFLANQVKVLSAAIFVFFILWSVLRQFSLYRKLSNLENEVKELKEKFEKELLGYSNSCLKYYTLHLKAFETDQLRRVLDATTNYISTQIEFLELFDAALKEYLRETKELYEDFVFTGLNFDENLVKRPEVDFLTKKHKLEFLKKYSLYSSFRQFKDNEGVLELFEIDGESLPWTEGELIAPNEDYYVSTKHSYKKIEGFNTELYLASEQEQRDILYSDVKQGQVGDCYFLAALAAIAHKMPTFIRKMLSKVGLHHVVSFFNNDSKTSRIEIDDKFWLSSDDLGVDRPIYAQFGSQNGTNVEIWPMLIEKAWAKVNHMNYTMINGHNQASRTIDYSFALTGERALYERISKDDSSYIERIKEHLKKKPIVLYSVNERLENSDPQLVEYHAYALLDFIANKFIIYNPHGNLLELEMNELCNNFQTILYFDFNLRDDKHLKSYYSDFFVRSTDSTLIRDLNRAVLEEIDILIGNKSLEEILREDIFGVSFDDTRDDIYHQLYHRSSPNMSVDYSFDIEKSVYRIGDQSFFSLDDNITEKPDNIILASEQKAFGVIQVYSSIRLKDIIYE